MILQESQWPREWFHVKLEIVAEIVELLQDNTLNNYVFDKRTGRIVNDNPTAIPLSTFI